MSVKDMNEYNRNKGVSNSLSIHDNTESDLSKNHVKEKSINKNIKIIDNNDNKKDDCTSVNKESRKERKERE